MYYVLKPSRNHAIAAVNTVSHTVTNGIARTYIRSSKPASLGARCRVSSLKFTSSTRFCADGMQIIVSTTSATIGSVGYHG